MKFLLVLLGVLELIYKGYILARLWDTEYKYTRGKVIYCFE